VVHFSGTLLPLYTRSIARTQEYTNARVHTRLCERVCVYIYIHTRALFACARARVYRRRRSHPSSSHPARERVHPLHMILLLLLYYIISVAADRVFFRRFSYPLALLYARRRRRRRRSRRAVAACAWGYAAAAAGFPVRVILVLYGVRARALSDDSRFSL